MDTQANEDHGTEQDEADISAAVLASVINAPDTRVRELSQALIRHLHAFIREVRPTEAEWEAGIRFLTQTGQLCTSSRQEFILLSDTLGVSMLVNAINHGSSESVTESTVLGPFYVDPPKFSAGGDISAGLNGVPMYVCGTVTNIQEQPLAGASVQVWHCDGDGFYDVQRALPVGAPAGRGRFDTDSLGRFAFWTVRPSAYPVPTDGPVGRMLDAQGRHPFRPEHIHFLVEAPGYRRLVTHLFAGGGDFLDSDVVFGVRPSLVQPVLEHFAGSASDGRMMSGSWFTLEHRFVLGELHTSPSGVREPHN